MGFCHVLLIYSVFIFMAHFTVVIQVSCKFIFTTRLLYILFFHLFCIIFTFSNVQQIRKREKASKQSRHCRWGRFWILHHCWSLSFAAAAQGCTHLQVTPPSRTRLTPAGSASVWYSRWPPAESPPCWAACPQTPAADALWAARNLRLRSAPGAAPFRSFSGWTQAQRNNHTHWGVREKGNKVIVYRATSGRAQGRGMPHPGGMAVQAEGHLCSALRCCPWRCAEPVEGHMEYAPWSPYDDKTSF